MSLDASIPTQANLGSELAEIHRKTREAVNANALGIAKGNMPSMTSVSMIGGQSSFDVGGTFVNNITPSVGLTLMGLTGGYSGQLVILRIDEVVGTPTLIINYNAANMVLQDKLPWIMHPGDMLWLINDGGAPPDVDGIWYEAHRSLYEAVLGLVTPNNTRVKLTVDDFLALNVVNL